MSDKTTIEWTDATWNPIRGCSRVSEGCRNCYAERMAARFSKPGEAFHGTITGGRWNGTVKTVSDALDQPMKWRRPRRIFVNSMSDLFHENLPDREIDNVFLVMERAKHHTFQVLTKRPQRMLEWFGGKSGAGLSAPALPNVWLGVSVENQRTADERIPLLLRVPAAVRFLSCEPLLGPVDLMSLPRPSEFHQSPYGWHHWLPRNLHWVIGGGESGPGARPMHPDWARGLRNQCQTAGIPFFFKQWGEWLPLDHQKGASPLDEQRHIDLDGRKAGMTWTTDHAQVSRVGKKTAGRLLDGRTWDEFPVAKA